jgi:hypothetical protein
MSKDVLRRCFFAYSFPFFSWIFPFFPFLPATHQEAFRRKFRIALRLIHRAPYVSTADLYTFTHEDLLDKYVKRYILKRLKKMYTSDLGSSLFMEDLFYWNIFHKSKNDGVGHLFTLKRVKNLKSKHRTLLFDWLKFIQEGDSK